VDYANAKSQSDSESENDSTDSSHDEELLGATVERTFLVRTEIPLSALPFTIVYSQ
jgi:hypothetical protein